MPDLPSGGHTGLSRDLDLFTIVMVGVGAMIGAGIFVLTGEAAGVAGPSLILAFALNGVVTLLTAMVYAELGSAIPEAGGGYLWIKEGLPGANAFLAGWMSWFAHAVAGALYALGFGAFIYELARLLGVPWESLGVDLALAKKLFGVAVAVAFAWINFRGASETGLAGNVITLAKLAVIGVFCAFGLKFMFFPDLAFTVGGAEGGMGLDKLRPFIPEETGWLGILSAMGLTFIAFEGYEIIVQAGEEAEDPRRTIPKAIFWSLAIVIPVYMLVAFVLVGASNTGLLLEALRSIGTEVPAGLSPESPNWQVLRHVGELGLAQSAAQFIPYGALLILVGGVLSTMSALNATTFSSTRVSFAMGRDRNLPDAFGKIHHRRHTPHFALLGTAVLIVLMVSFVPITTVAAAADIMFLLLFLQVNVAALTLRKKYGDKLAYGFVVPFFPLVPAVSLVGLLVLALFMFDHYPVAWLYVAAWLVVGFVLYRLYASKREKPEKRLPVVLEEAPLEVKPDAVLVGVAEPESARQLVHLGGRIAAALDTELVLLHVVAVPRQLPLRQGTRFVGEGKKILEEMQQQVSTLGIPVRSLIRLARRPAEAIVRTARDFRAAYLVLGWHGAIRRDRRRPQVGRNIDRVIKNANAHAIVCETEGIEGVLGDGAPNVLVPLFDSHTGSLAIGVASALVGRGFQSGTITLLHLSEEGPDDERQEELREKIARQMRETGTEEPESLFDESSPLVLEFRRIRRGLVEDLVELSEEYDWLVIETHRDELFGRKVLRDEARELADGALCPVILVRPREPQIKFNIQTFFQFFRELEEEGRPEEDVEEGDETGNAGEWTEGKEEGEER